MTRILLASMTFACSDEENANDYNPKIVELDKQALVVGETLYLYGQNFSDFDYQTNPNNLNYLKSPKRQSTMSEFSMWNTVRSHQSPCLALAAWEQKPRGFTTD